jgi:hypothetical protein
MLNGNTDDDLAAPAEKPVGFAPGTLLPSKICVF